MQRMRWHNAWRIRHGHKTGKDKTHCGGCHSSGRSISTILRLVAMLLQKSRNLKEHCQKQGDNDTKHMKRNVPICNFHICCQNAASNLQCAPRRSSSVRQWHQHAHQHNIPLPLWEPNWNVCSYIKRLAAGQQDSRTVIYYVTSTEPFTGTKNFAYKVRPLLPKELCNV